MNTLDYIILAAIAIIAIITVSIIKRRKYTKKLRQKIDMQWGKRPVENYKDEDMQAIACYFDNLREAEAGRTFLDSITWNDLDMDNIFKRLNSTQSTVGEEYLYALLREPVTDGHLLNERNKLAEFFQKNTKQRIQLQFLLARLGKERFSGASNYFFSNAEYASFRRYKYIFLLAIFLLSPIVMTVSISTGILMIIASFFINMTVYYKAKNELSTQLDSMSYMVNLITYSRKIADHNISGLEEYSGILKKTASKIKGTSIKSFYQIFYQTQDPLFEYFKIVFLVELIAFESINKKIMKHRSDLRTLYETVGLLDSMVAVASFRQSVPFYSVPELYKANQRRGPSLSFEEIYHPLIDKPVTNSVNLKKPVLITGSNASGKSTFLKTAAINSVFAQTISTCLASRYESSYFMIYTSMALKDNLLSSESYYIAEIKSLKSHAASGREKLHLHDCHP